MHQCGRININGLFCFLQGHVPSVFAAAAKALTATVAPLPDPVFRGPCRLCLRQRTHNDDMVGSFQRSGNRGPSSHHQSVVSRRPIMNPSIRPGLGRVTGAGPLTSLTFILEEHEGHARSLCCSLPREAVLLGLSLASTGDLPWSFRPPCFCYFVQSGRRPFSDLTARVQADLACRVAVAAYVPPMTRSDFDSTALVRGSEPTLPRPSCG